ncbi:MAG: DUF4384 domain-containing protein [bacterium]|jgi:hypothetical protein|nr:DUF4384 domain-containing protein [candidate division KSB1 bacterium]MDH7558698.1 DUF4384 domain-containing protein [bacterium]
MNQRTLVMLAAVAAVAMLAVPARSSIDYSMAVEVWTDRGEDFFYLPGDPFRVYFRAPEDCYLVSYEIDTEGNVYLLFPAPYGRAFFARGGLVYCVNDLVEEADLAVFGPSGVGYIGVLASPVPFRVPTWLRPHPALRGWVTVYQRWYYPPVVVEPYVAIFNINAKIAEGWGWGLRFGVGYCWFYVERRYVPVYPIWHPRYWEVRLVTRPLYDRLWARHDGFYRLPPRRGEDRYVPRQPERQPPERRPFERPRQFRASPAPEPPAWVKAVESWRSHDNDPVRLGRPDDSRQRIAREVSSERESRPEGQSAQPGYPRVWERTGPQATPGSAEAARSHHRVPHDQEGQGLRNRSPRGQQPPVERQVFAPRNQERQREPRTEGQARVRSAAPVPVRAQSQEARPAPGNETQTSGAYKAPNHSERKPLGPSKGSDGASRFLPRGRSPRS